MVSFKGRGKTARVSALALLLVATASAAQPDTNGFAEKVYAITKAGNHQAYKQLMHPRCPANSVMPKSFELNVDLFNKLTLAPPSLVTLPLGCAVVSVRVGCHPNLGMAT